MTYVYCHKCESGNDAPTIRQLLTDEYECHVCNAQLVAPATDTKAQLLHILDRLETVEAALGITPSEIL